MRKRIEVLKEWLSEQYEDYCLDYESTDSDFNALYRNCCEIIGSVVTELNDLLEADEEAAEFEWDGQPDDLQENEDFAQDGHFENRECNEDGFWQ